jgi:hypothetical protein
MTNTSTRRVRAVLALALVSTSVAGVGCTTEQLRFTTLRISNSLPDINERQVLTNLARTAETPSSLPYFALISDGTVDIKDNGGFSSGFTGDPRKYTTSTTTFTGGRQIDGNWSLKPLTNPDRISAMRAAYQIALGMTPDPDGSNKLSVLIGPNKFAQLRSGWVCTGSYRDVPWKETCYVSKSGKTYVWILNENIHLLNDLVLTMLDIYTSTLGYSRPVPGKVSPGPGASPEEFFTPGMPHRLFDGNGFDPNRGLYFVR